MDPSGHSGLDIFTPPSKYVHTGDIPVANDSNASYDITKKANTEAACSIINSYINDNQGAFMGVTAGVALVVLTAPASAPVLAVIGAGMAGGAVGMVIGGVLEKGISSADIARTLKTKYNIDVTEHQNLDLDSLPSEVKDLCSQYDKNFEDMEGYFETGSVLMGLGVAFHEAGYFLDSLQASIAEKSKKAYESLKSWFNKTFKGGSKGGLDALSTPSSKVLRQNLIDAGVEVPDYPNAAHHIVAGSSPKAAEARAILQKYGVDINDAANGTFLPTVRDVAEGAYHPSLHTNTYYDKVNKLLSEATCKEDVLDILEFIGDELSSGTFMQ